MTSASITLYHSSPNPNIKKLKANSYATIFPHVAYIFGLNYSSHHPMFAYETDKKTLTHCKFGRTWKDFDAKPYDFGPKIKFKKGHRPDQVGTMYKLITNYDNIIFHKNYPYEMQIKKPVDVKKVPKNKIKNLINKSKKLFDAFEKYYETLM